MKELKLELELLVYTSSLRRQEIGDRFIPAATLFKMLSYHPPALNAFPMQRNIYLRYWKLSLSFIQFQYILKGKRNAYFDFQNVGFIMSTNFVLLTAIYTHLYRQ